MRVSDYLVAIPIGLVIGVLGRLVLPGRQRIGVFVTFLIGVAAAVAGTWIAGHLSLSRGDAHWHGLSWNWILLGIQVGFAVVGVGLANKVTHTALADNDDRPRRRTRRRRTRTAR
ncbi:GlsB/YeaQ/YmgE family stress response membrane protein [Rugosimonospora africana]|uniref:Transglycosylase associated protein n=1 Tax=Rugosimonospora africana TaxID=556532 RepID=A0A8J3VUG1_9ACTN|nr:GlsB/YeaQ/YmgE family stress response membrane protein [Rugosimonospora africana]GIH18598.1 hypothetical protein Raf01_67700 [Rugosimonospora africana]